MKLFCLSYDRRYMAGILPLRRKTQNNQSINRYMRMYNFLSINDSNPKKRLFKYKCSTEIQQNFMCSC